MKKRLISAAVSAAMICTAIAGVVPASAAGAKTPTYQTAARQMESLGRGLIAAKVTNGVYLSWRLLGDESLTNQSFDIYKNGKLLKTTDIHAATCYTDTIGKATDTYVVVKKGEDPAGETPVTPGVNHLNGQSQYSNLTNSFMYTDIALERPDDSNGGHYYTVDKNTEGGANDASVGDLDGDGEYEIVLKWDPTNSKDAAGGGETGRTYIDGYKIDPSNTDPTKNENGHLYMWRIDLGPHVRSGAHENPFLVYDFDGDGKSEIASITGPGATDGLGRYVTEVGDTETIRNADNTLIQLRKGKNIGPEYYTIFDGETGAALCTTDAIPIGREDGGDYGDAKMNRSSRYLAAVAYIDGVHPSIVMCRGYYNRAVLRAYTWDGTEMTLQWEHDGNVNDASTMYGQGNHNLSVADIDDDGRDEIIYGSASLDDDGKTVLGNTRLGHGDAMHVNDFNNDGKQEVFSVKEKPEGFKKYAEDLRVASTGEHFWSEGKIVTSGDNGRGVMDNIDDAYAKTHPNALAIGWSSGLANAHDLNGDDLKAKPANAGSGTFDNFLVYWDADLGRELLDANIIQKYDAATGTTTRFWGETDGYTLTGGTTNNYSKRNPSLVADIWGDWREEIIMPVGKGKDDTPLLRIYTSTLPTTYRLTTLMHDCQYRLAIAWQNVGYNQPPHTSYYVGSAALATDASGKELNYLAPAVPYTKVTYDAPQKVDVTGISMPETSMTVEKGKTAVITASVVPADATKKGITWTSSDTSVATVSNGKVTAVDDGKAIITATTKEGGFKAECEVTVFSHPVTGVALSEKLIEMSIGYTIPIDAYITPDTASDKSVTWKSEDPSVATVDSDGNVTGVSYGRTRVSVTSNDSGQTAYCVVKVKPMEIVEATGDNKFDFAEPNTDANISLSAAATSASLNFNNANSGTLIQKVFENYTNNKATIKFNLTTGGVKLDGKNWNWTGHEYSLGLKFVGADGENILNIVQPYGNGSEGGAGKMTYEAVDGTKGNFESDWTQEIEGLGYIQGSAKTWLVTAEFDYDTDTLSISIGGGTDGVDGKYSKEFKLNGSSFKTLQLYTTKDGTGTIKASPSIANLTYTKTKSIEGNTYPVYQRGAGTQRAWDKIDITGSEGWTQVNSDAAALAVENGRMWYNPTKPGKEYHAEKTFEKQTDGKGVISYDIDWHFGLATGRDSVYEYLQIGNMRLGWMYGYKVQLSTDGGTTWKDSDSDGTADVLFTGANEEYTKNVKAIFTEKTNNVKLYFDGALVYDGAYSAEAAPADMHDADKVMFGLVRGGATSDWSYPNGLDKIVVSCFVEEKENIDFSEIVITGVEGNTVNFEWSIIDDFHASVDVIGALYDNNGVLVETASKPTEFWPESMTAQTDDVTHQPDSFTFNNKVEDYNLKIFLWDENMDPYCEAAYRASGIEPDPTPMPSPTVEPPTVTVDPPTANVEPGMVAYGTEVTLSRNKDSNIIRYSVNNGEEQFSFTDVVIVIKENTTIKASSSVDALQEGVKYDCPEIVLEYTVDPATAPTPSPSPSPSPSPTPAPTIDPNIEYEPVFETAENFLMEADAANNKWIRSFDSDTAAFLTESTADIGGNTTPKMYLANKAVQYVLDDAITSGAFRLSYDFYIDKTTNESSYGRYFRTYFANAAESFDPATGKAAANTTDAAFFHMMDYQNAVYTTTDTDHLAATQNNFTETSVIPVEGVDLPGGRWYRVVITCDLDDKLINIGYYDHENGQYNPEAISAEPYLSGKGYLTEGRTAELKQIKFMRTAGGDLYYDNIKLEKEKPAQ